jgi:hypothetical protein
MRVRLALLIFGVIAVGIVATTAWYARYDYDPTAGPIDGSQNGLGFAAPVEVGQDFSIGITALHNDGRKPIVVERVRLLGVTGNLELLGVDTRQYPKGNAQILLGDFGFPPPKYPAKPLIDQDVVPVPTAAEPQEGLELVIGVRAAKPGIAAYRAVDVFYRVGKRRYHELFNANTVHLCAPVADFVDPVSYQSRQECPPKAIEKRFEDRVLEWPPPPSAAATASLRG